MNWNMCCTADTESRKGRRDGWDLAGVLDNDDDAVASAQRNAPLWAAVLTAVLPALRFHLRLPLLSTRSSSLKSSAVVHRTGASSSPPSFLCLLGGGSGAAFLWDPRSLRMHKRKPRFTLLVLVQPGMQHVLPSKHT